MPSASRQRDVEQQHCPLLAELETSAAGLWFIRDSCGVACALLTWILLLSAGLVVNVVFLLPSLSGWFSLVNGLLFNSLTFLALSSHLRTMLTDPGAVPKGTASSEQLEKLQLRPGEVLYKCPKCCSIKPERAHHCSICGRCIRRMDHHCPWINNCVGENNQRYFILFNMYVSVASGHSLLLCGHRFVSCVHSHWNTCSVFSPAVTILLMIFLSMKGLLFLTFTGAMFATQLHSVCSDQMDMERLQPQSNQDPRMRRRPGRGLTGVFGGPPSLRWFSPFTGLSLPPLPPLHLLLRRRVRRSGAQFSI